MATHNYGKDVDRSTPWSERIWDKRGYWYYARMGPTGAAEYSLDNPHETEDHELAHQERRLAKPRGADRSELSPMSTTYEASPPRSVENSPVYTTDARDNRQDRAVPYGNEIYSRGGMSRSPPEKLNWKSNYNASAGLSGQIDNRIDDQADVDVADKRLRGLSIGHDSERTRQLDFGGSTYLSRPDIRPLQLDDRYERISTDKLDKFFRVGRVFKTLWSEPAGDGGDDVRTARRGPGNRSNPSQLSNFEHETYEGHFLGGKVFSEIRRFVVIEKNHGNVLCCPIHTYGGQACLKVGLPDVHKHSIIHTSTYAPPEQHYEDEHGKIISENLTNPPIRVDRQLRDSDGDLGELSRVNFSKVYTVELYMRVLNIGLVHPSMMERLQNCIENARSKGPMRPRHMPRRKSQGKAWIEARSEDELSSARDIFPSTIPEEHHDDHRDERSESKAGTSRRKKDGKVRASERENDRDRERNDLPSKGGFSTRSMDKKKGDLGGDRGDREHGPPSRTDKKYRY